MSRRRCLEIALFLTPALIAGLSVVTTVEAKERQARLTVQIDIEGQETVRDGSNRADGRIRQHVVWMTTLRTDGVLNTVNTKDPQYPLKMQARADEHHRRVLAIQSRQAQRAAATPPAGALSQQEMMQRVQQMQATCQGNQQCLTREAMKLSAARVSADPSVQARLTGYGSAHLECEQRHAKDAKQREACIADVRRKAGGAADDTDTQIEDEPRYLHYYGQEPCASQFEARIDDRTEGQYADVQGMVPYVITREANERGTPAGLKLMCASLNLVLDTKTGTVYTDGGVPLPQVRGVSTRSERGRTQRSEETLSLAGEPSAWLSTQLRQMPRSGSASTRIPLTQTSAGQRQGALNVKLSWKLEDL